MLAGKFINGLNRQKVLYNVSFNFLVASTPSMLYSVFFYIFMQNQVYSLSLSVITFMCPFILFLVFLFCLYLFNSKSIK
jgi:uncharacterized membrane protein